MQTFTLTLISLAVTITSFILAFKLKSMSFEDKKKEARVSAIAWTLFALGLAVLLFFLRPYKG